MERSVEVRDLLVPPVDCNRILYEIIRSNGHEIDMIRNDIRSDGCRWHLYHRPDLHLLIEWDTLPPAFILHILEECKHLEKLLRA